MSIETNDSTFRQHCDWAARNIKLAIAKELDELQAKTGMYPDSVDVGVDRRMLLGQQEQFKVSEVNLTFKI